MKDKKKIVIGLSCLLMVGTLCGVIGVNKTPSNQISSDITVQGKGIGFKLLAERNFKNGAFEKTISYSFNPDTITDKTVTMEVYYADEKEDCCAAAGFCLSAEYPFRLRRIVLEGG